MTDILKLNPLIVKKIDSLDEPKNMKDFLTKVLYLELEKSEKNEDRFSADYETLVEAYSQTAKDG